MQDNELEVTCYEINEKDYLVLKLVNYNDEDFILEDKFGCPICDYNYCSIYEV